MNLPAIIASENAIPIPVARYNVLSYVSTDNSNLPQTFAGSSWPNATLRRGTQNVLTTASPRYITIYSLPPAYPTQTGGVHIGTSNTFRSVEMWVRLQRLSNAGQYFFDFRGGLVNGFSIASGTGSSTGGNNGTGIVGTTYFSNTTAGTWTATTNPSFLLSNAGWVQFVQTFSNDVTDTATLFSRFDSPTTDAFVQGMPLQFADIAFYRETLNARQVKALFNAKCSRYSLSPRP